jgi:predicted permease
MRSLREWIRRLWGSFRHRPSDRDLEEELRFHLDQLSGRIQDHGASPAEAWRAARLRAGAVALTMDALRDQRGLPFIETVGRDLRHAARILRKTLSFTLAAVLTLGTAIGACTAIYSIVYGLVLRPLPYPRPEQIMRLEQIDASGRRYSHFSDLNYEDVRDQTTSFSAMAEFNQGSSSIVVGDVPLRAGVSNVSAGFFDVLATEPALGRRFTPEERREGGSLAVIVSQRFWKEHFRDAPDLSTAHLKVNGQVHAVVGVMPDGFAFPPDTELWSPREASSRNPFRTGHQWLVVARLRELVGLASARSEASAVAARLKGQYGQDTEMSDVAIIPLQESLVGYVRPTLWLLLASVALLLTVACANVANVLLARATARRRELAVRAALGATTLDLIVPLVAESLIVAACGGVLGLGLAAATVRSTSLVEAAALPHVGEIRMSWSVVLFAIGVTGLTALTLSLVAAWRERRPDVVASLKDAARGQTAGGAVGRLRNALVVAQLGVSVVLLVGVDLLGRSLILLVRQELGFRTTALVTVETTVPMPPLRITPQGVQLDDQSVLGRRAQVHREILGRLGTIPGVLEAGGITTMPLTGGGSNGAFLIVSPSDHDIEQLSLSALIERQNDPSRTGTAEFRVTSAGYFRAMGIPLVRGRVFDDRDGQEAPHVAVISDTLARTRWPTEDPIGLRIEFGGLDGDMRVFTIVGIVGDVREQGFDRPPPRIFYADYRQRPLHTFAFTYVLRTATAAGPVIEAARRVIHDLEPEVPPRFRTMEAVVDQSIAARRFTFLLTALFAGGALVVAVLGIYGVLAFRVAERAHEFGIRRALGARAVDIQRLVLSQGAWLIGMGLVVGEAIALAASRVLTHQLFGIRPTDPTAYVEAAIVLALAALVACELPAFRAIRVDPARVLRTDG